jgi:hypothetical protein
MTNLEPVPPKKRGCFFYGCITCIILALIAGIGLFVAAHYALKYANGMVAEYTDVSPMTLPKSDLPPDDLKQLKARVAAFDAAMDAHTNVPPLILTGPEINALISDTPQTKEFKDRFFVALDGDEIKGQLSLPLDGIPQLQIFNVKGRYLNGSGTFKASITNGLLYVMVQSLEVKGKALPAKFLAGLQQQNLAQSFNDRKNGTAFENYESVVVKDGTLIVKPKGN